MNRRKSSARGNKSFRLEELEPRVLFSADGLALATDLTVAPLPSQVRLITDTTSVSTGDVASEAQHQPQELVFIDIRVPDYRSLLADIEQQAQGGRRIESVVLSDGKDGVAQISAALKGRSEIAALHFITHGSAGNVQLGDGRLDLKALVGRAAEVRGWGQALAADADILLYGCDIAQSAEGVALIEALSRLTGADVAASDDRTGGAQQGADWELERRVGNIEASPAVDAAGQAHWAGVLEQTAPVAPTALSPPLSFEENVGQSADFVDFLARGSGYTVYLDGGNALIDLQHADGGGHVVDLALQGARANVPGVGEGMLAAKSNYLVGGASQFRTDIANYSAVRYQNVYDGIDVRYYGNERALEYDFLVGPGADANAIRLKFEGAQDLSLDEQGNLIVSLDAQGHVIRFQAPVSYQSAADGSREAVQSSYVIHEDGSIGFSLGSHDTARALVIDPTLTWETYLGGTGADTVEDVATDANGNVYVTGHTASATLPTTAGAYDTSLTGGSEAFVVKYNASGVVQYATYLGGNGNDWGYEIAVNSSGQAYIVGETASTNLAVVNGAYSDASGAANDGFLVRLNAAGDAILYSSYTGGSASSYLSSIVLSGTDIAYVAGATGATPDVFVQKFNTALTGLASEIWSSTLGGAGVDRAYTVALDSGGSLYVAGETFSVGPGTGSPFDSTYDGAGDAFIGRFTAAGVLDYWTYFGGAGTDGINGLAIDSADHLYVTGWTTSSSSIATGGAYDTTLSGTQDGFLAEFDLGLSGAAQQVFGTYYGISGSNAANAIAFDAGGNPIIAGWTTGTVSVTGDALQSASGGGTDGYVASFNKTGSQLLYGSYLGGAGTDRANSVAHDDDGSTYIVGVTYSSGLATPAAPDSTADTTNGEGFVAKLSLHAAPANTVPGAQSTNEDTTKVFSSGNGNQISIADTDAGGASNQVTLSVTSGTLTLAATIGLTFVTGDGSADTSMTIRGTAADINAALNGLSYVPAPDYNGSATLTVTSTDSTLLSLDIDSALLGRYDFESSGSLGIDTSPAAGHGATVSGATAAVDGTRGNVLNLDGNDYLDISGHFGNPASATLAAWINLTSVDTFGAEVISLGDSLTLRVNSDGALWGFYYNGSAWVMTTYAGAVTGPGWHHVAYSFDDAGDTATLYLDGAVVAVTSTTDSVSYSLGANSAIGTHGNGSTNYDFTGTIDDARIYNRALSSGEIAALANDLQLRDIDMVSVAVTAVNDPPVAVSDAYTVNEDATLAPGWWNTAWSRRSQITFSGNTFTGATSLTDFPVLITLNSGNIDYSLTQDNGQDLRFFDADGTALAYEIETWNEAGDSTVWVRVPQVDATGTDSISMYYGNASAVAGQNADAVWNANYQAVYHLSDSGTAIADSTANAMTGTATNGPVTGTGRVGGDLQFDGSNDYVTLGANPAIVDGASAVTFSAWINPTTLAAGYCVMGASINNGGVATASSRVAFETSGSNIHVIVRSDDATVVTVDTTTNPLATGTWQYVSAVVDVAADTVQVYVDGVLQATTAVGVLPGTSFPNTPSASAVIGANEDALGPFFGGQIDEVRFARVAQTAAWQKADYLSMTNAFVTVGAAASAPVTGGVLDNDSDVDNTGLTAVLVSGPSHASGFALNADGTFSYTPATNYNGTDTFVYHASDGTAHSADVTVTLTITPVNDAPTITSGGAGASASVTAAENQTAVTTVSATDVDAGATQTYSITGGADAAKFSINSSTGVLTFLAAPDFENPTDGGGDNVYDVTVEVSDGVLTDTQDIAVTVTNVNESPAITSNGGGASAAINAAENQTAVGTIASADVDGGVASYSIVGGADAALFTIDANTGVLAFTAAPNYEAATDAGADNVYDVTVQVSDGNGGTDTQAIAVSVTNVNEVPVITSPGSAVATFESTAITFSTGAGTAISIADLDAGSQTLQVTLTATHGTVSLASLSGLSFSLGDGNADAIVTFTGTLADLNAALDGMQFGPATGYTGTATVQIDVDDLGHSGSGGPLTAQSTVSINVAARTFLQGNYLELGLNQLGGLGSTIAAPTGFVRSGQNLGAISDRGRDGWAQYDGDFILPGSPLDMWGLGIGATTINYDNVAVTGGAASMTDSGSSQSLVWSGGTTDVGVSQTFTLGRNNLYMDLTVTLTNTSGATLTDLYFFRHADPDNNYDTNGIFDTTNTVVSQGDATGVAYVTATQGDGSSMGLMGFGSNARVTYGNFGDVNAAEAWAGINGNTATGSATADVGITLVYRVASLTAGQSTTLQMRYVFAGASAPTVDLDLNDSTAAGSGSHATYVEGGAAVAIADSDIQVLAGDIPNLSTASISLTNPQTGDRLLVSGSSAASGTFASGISWSRTDTLVTLSGSYSATDYSAAIEAVQFECTSDAPSATQRSITVNLSDGSLSSNTAQATIDVSAVNDEQVIATNTGMTVAEGSAGSVIGSSQLSTTDLDNTAGQLIYTVTSVPLHGVLKLGGVALSASDTFTQADVDANQLQYDHDGSETTSDAFVFSVDDGAGSASTGTFTITVTAVNDNSPVITSDAGGATASVNVAENTTGVTTVVATDADLPAQTLTYAIVAGADQALFSINSSTGVLSFNAPVDFEAPADSGADNVYDVTVQVSDGTHTDTQAIAVVVSNVNEAPAGSDTTLALTEDTPYVLSAGDFGFSDPDAGDVLGSVRIDTLPGAGTLRLSGTPVTAGQVISAANIAAGNLVFAPAANANGTGYASWTFSVRDTNGPTFDALPNTLTVDVAAVNDAPVAGGESYSVTQDTMLTVSAGAGVLGNDVDVEGAPLTPSVVTGPVNGVLLLNSDGSFSYTPNTGYVGVDAFTYRVNDGSLNSSAATVTLNVTAPATNPGGGGSSPPPAIVVDPTGGPQGPGAGDPGADPGPSGGASASTGQPAAEAPQQTGDGLSGRSEGRQSGAPAPFLSDEPVSADRLEQVVMRAGRSHGAGFAGARGLQSGMLRPEIQPAGQAESGGQLQLRWDQVIRQGLYGSQINTSGNEAEIALPQWSKKDTAEFSLATIVSPGLWGGLVAGFGTAWWAGRAGVLMGSVLAGTPAWARLDPLPIAYGNRGQVADEDADDLEEDNFVAEGALTEWSDRLGRNST